MARRRKKTAEEVFSDANDQLIALWGKYRKKHKGKLDELSLDLRPNVYPTPRLKKSNEYVLFVGLNPSCRDDAKDKVKWSVPVEEVIDYESDERDNEQSTNNKYFTPLLEIAHSIGAKFIDIDMYAVRQTDSREVQRLIKGEEQFFQEQYEVFDGLLFNLLENMPPKAIIMNSAKASRRLMHKGIEKFGLPAFASEEKLEKAMDNSYGCHFVKLKDHDKGKKIPLFFSGMISNGVTDRFARMRLQLQLKKATAHAEREAKKN